jgi:ureidoglycolate hydrolase
VSRPRVVSTALAVEVMSDEAFEPFGWLIDAPRETPPAFVGVATRGWSVPFEIAGNVQVCALFTEFAGVRFDKLERHLHVTQTFIPMSGSVSVVAVAPSAGVDDPRPPAVADVRAFLVDPARGYVLRRGTWHSLDRLPLQPPGATFAMITEVETTDEMREAATPSRTDVFDFAANLGVEFELELEQVR